MLILVLLLSLFAGVYPEEMAINYSKRIQYQPPLTPILLIPGIGGSILYTDIPGDPGRRIWIAYRNAEQLAEYLVGFNHSVYTKYDDNGLHSIDTLNPDLYIGIDHVRYFSTIIQKLRDIGYVSGINLFGHPYDWRLSVRDISKEERLNFLIKRYNPIIVSHSMGSLVVADYIRNNGNADITAWVSIAGPLRGAAGQILKAFVDGYNLGNPLISDNLARRIAENSYAAYDLLPNELSPEPTITIDNIHRDWLSSLKRLPTFKSDRIVRRDPVNVAIRYITNSAIATPYDYIKNGRVNTFQYVAGDGTVPYQSMISTIGWEHNLNDTDLNHVSMLHSDKLIDVLMNYTDNSCLSQGYYVLGDELIVVSDKLATLNGLQIQNYRLSMDCLQLIYNDKRYTRNIGYQCQRYYDKQNITEHGMDSERCIYGYVYRTEVRCRNDETYSVSGGCQVGQIVQSDVKNVAIYIVSGVSVALVLLSVILGVLLYRKRNNNNNYVQIDLV